MDNQWLGQDSRVETEVKAMVRTIEAGVLDFPPLSGHWVEMSGENADEAVDLGFSVGYPAWDEAKFAVSDVVSDFTDDKLGTCIGPQILWPISVWLWDVGDCHLFITDCERLVLPCNWNSRDSMLEDPPKMFYINSIPKPILWDSCGGKSFSLKPPYRGQISNLLRPWSAHCCSWRASWLGVHLIRCVNPGKSMSDSGLYRRKPPWCHAMKTWWGHLVTPRCTKKYMFSLILDAKTVHSRSTTWLRSRTWHFFWQNKGIYRVG
jgi:hypothetical protein